MQHLMKSNVDFLSVRSYYSPISLFENYFFYIKQSFLNFENLVLMHINIIKQ